MNPGVIPIAIFWFLYMSGLGVIFPYQSLYFQEHVGLTGTQLGMALAVHPLMGIVASPLWGQWADRTGRRRGALMIVAMGSALGYFLVPYASTFSTLLFCLAFLSLFSSSAMAIASSLSGSMKMKPGGIQKPQFPPPRTCWPTSAQRDTKVLRDDGRVAARTDSGPRAIIISRLHDDGGSTRKRRRAVAAAAAVGGAA